MKACLISALPPASKFKRFLHFLKSKNIAFRFSGSLHELSTFAEGADDEECENTGEKVAVHTYSVLPSAGLLKDPNILLVARIPPSHSYTQQLVTYVALLDLPYFICNSMDDFMVNALSLLNLEGPLVKEEEEETNIKEEIIDDSTEEHLAVEHEQEETEIKEEVIDDKYRAVKNQFKPCIIARTSLSAKTRRMLDFLKSNDIMYHISSDLKELILYYNQAENDEFFKNENRMNNEHEATFPRICTIENSILLLTVHLPHKESLIQQLATYLALLDLRYFACCSMDEFVTHAFSLIDYREPTKSVGEQPTNKNEERAKKSEKEQPIAGPSRLHRCSIPGCQASFGTQELLFHHFIICHGNIDDDHDGGGEHIREEDDAASDESDDEDGLPPQNCPLCPELFALAEELQCHLNRHDDRRPFKCSMCESRFQSRWNCQRHVRNVHEKHLSTEPAGQSSSAPQCRRKNSSSCNNQKTSSSVMTDSFLVARIPPDLFCTRVIILLEKHDVEFVVSTELNELFLFITSKIQKTSLLPRLVTRCLAARLLHPCPELSELLMENNIEFLVSSSIYNLFKFVTSIDGKEPEPGLISPAENFFENPMSTSQMRQMTWTNKDSRMSVTPPDRLSSKHADSVKKKEPRELLTSFVKEEHLENAMGPQTDPLIPNIPPFFHHEMPEVHRELPCPSFLSAERATCVGKTHDDQHFSQTTSRRDSSLTQPQQYEPNTRNENSVDELNSMTTPSGDSQLLQNDNFSPSRRTLVVSAETISSDTETRGSACDLMNDELKPSMEQQGEHLKGGVNGSTGGPSFERRAFGCQWDGCPYSCSKWSKLLNHMKTHSDEEENKYTTNQSGIRSVPRACLPIARIGPKKTFVSSAVSGRNCSRTLMFNQRILAYPTNRNLEFRCEFCSFSCNRAELLEQHRKMTHFRCVYCPFDCADLWDLTEHVRIEHDAQ